MLRWTKTAVSISGPSPSEDRKHLQVTPLAPSGTAELAPVLTLSYKDGVFTDIDGKLRCYATTFEGQRFILSQPVVGGSDAASVIQSDILIFQQIAPLAQPLAMTLSQDQKVWVIRNLPIQAQARRTEMNYTLNPIVYDDLPGYVEILGLKKIESASHGSVAATFFRDQAELFVEDNDGTLWARLGIEQFSLIALKPAVAGLNSVVIDQDGFNEWREVRTQATLLAGGSTDTRVLAVSANHEPLFDSLMGHRPTLLPKGSYLLFAGKPGARVEATLE